MKNSKVRLITNILLVLVFVLGLGSLSKGAQAAVPQQAPAGTMSSADAGINVMAARPWTPAEMAAAKPYPMTTTLAGTGSNSLDALSKADGPVGTVGAASPGKAPANIPSLTDAFGPPSVLGYSYPAPFTRNFIVNFTSQNRWPFATVGKLFFTQLGVNYVCSASVEGLNALLTAGHCVHAGNGSSTGWSYNMQFVPAYVSATYCSQEPFGCWYTSNLITRTKWYLYGTGTGWGEDYGGARVQQRNIGGVYKSIGQITGYLGATWNRTVNLAWWALGYPQAAPFNGLWMVACESSFAYQETYGGAATPALTSIGCDMTGGCSGGPWVWQLGSGNYVNSVNESRHTDQPLELNGPYFGTDAGNLILYIRAW